MSERNITNNHGVGFTGLLTVLFIALKLTHVIDWSWWWVLAPVWITTAIVCALLLGLGVVMLVARWLE